MIQPKKKIKNHDMLCISINPDGSNAIVARQLTFEAKGLDIIP